MQRWCEKAAHEKAFSDAFVVGAAAGFAGFAAASGRYRKEGGDQRSFTANESNILIYSENKTEFSVRASKSMVIIQNARQRQGSQT